MFQTVDVAAISFVPEKFGLEANCDRLEETFRKAAKGGAQLALAPEGVIEGYVVNEIIEGDEPAQRMKDVTITMRGAIMKRFKNLAKELGIALAFGCAFGRALGAGTCRGAACAACAAPWLSSCSRRRPRCRRSRRSLAAHCAH